MPDPAAAKQPPPAPPTLHHVIGQKQVVDRLKVALDASFMDNRPVPHTLLLGPPGLGKTLLAQLVAKEAAAEFHESLGQTLATPGMLSGFLLKPEQDKSVVFIDEAHELSPLCQTTLYRWMEEGVLFVQQPYSQNIVKMKTARLTLVASTTDPQKLLGPLRDRFLLLCQMKLYSSEEVVGILRQRVRQLGWPVDEACLEPIASRAFGTPRIAFRLLESAHRTARAEGAATLDYGHLLRTLKLEQLDEYGLGPDEQRYLLLLAESSNPVRVGVLSGKMRVSHVTLSQVIEERLLYLDLIERLPQGRILTGKGIEHARKLKQEANGA